MATATRGRAITKTTPAKYQAAKARVGQPVTSIKSPPSAAAQAYQQALTNIGTAVAQTPTPAAEPTTGTTKTRPGPGWLDQRVSLGQSGRQLGAPTSAPSFGTSAAPATLTNYSKTTSTRLIVVALGVGGAAIIISGKRFPSYTSSVNGKDVKVPGTLHAFAGLLIAGSVALVVNEVAPDLGMALAVGLIFIALGDAQVFVSLGDRIFGKNRPNPAPAPAAKSPGNVGTGKGVPVLPSPPSGGGIWSPPQGPGGSQPIEVPYGSPSG